MIKGFDLNLNKHVFAEDVDKKDKHTFICPCCKDKLIVKQGDILQHHFSHYRENDINKMCILKTTTGSYDEWIYSMMTGFAPNEVEVNIEDQVFDILLENGKSITLAYIEHLMEDKGVVPILELEHKQKKHVKEWNVLLNMSDEFEMKEYTNSIFWCDRDVIDENILNKKLDKLKLWVYYNNMFYRVSGFSNKREFMRTMNYDVKVEGVEKFREFMMKEEDKI